MEWERLDNIKASEAIYRIKGLNFDNHDNYNELINEVVDKIIAIRKTFKKYL
jgi:hypothetical protein